MFYKTDKTTQMWIECRIIVFISKLTLSIWFDEVKQIIKFCKIVVIKKMASFQILNVLTN